MNNIVKKFTIGQTEIDVAGVFSGASWLAGKKIVAYGDSSGTTANNFLQMLINEYGVTNVTNRCIGGSTFSQLRPGVNPDYESNSGYQQITAATDLNTFDVLLIIYGINDWQTSQKIYSNNYNDVYSFEYCTEQVIKHVNATAPNCKPVFIYPWYCRRNSFDFGVVNDAGCTIDAYIDCGIAVCNKYQCDYINLYNLTNVNDSNYSAFLRDDNGIFVHAEQNLAHIACELILMQNFNSGMCHENSWSDNLIMAYPGNLNISPGECANLGGKINTYPARKFSSAGNAVQLMSVSNDNNVLIRFSGYANQQIKVRFMTSKNGTVSTTPFVTISPGYFDMRLIVPNGDKLTPLITGAENGSLIWGLIFQVHGAPGAKGCSERVTLAGGDITWNSAVGYWFSDGMAHMPPATVVTKREFNAGEILFSSLFPDFQHTEIAFRNGSDIGMIAYIHHNCYTQTAIPNARTFQIPACDIPIEFYQA